MYAGAPGDPPEGSKHAKALEWLRRTNREQDEPLAVLGAIIEGYMDEDENSQWFGPEKSREYKGKITRALSKSNLSYLPGGRVIGALSTPSVSLDQHIKKRNIQSINEEFTRALDSVESEPREALSAACNILESVFKVYIEESSLEMPAKKDIKGTWKVIRENLNFDPSKVEDRDLQEILTGLASVVGGIGALRTHASTAHGRGKVNYKVEPRHARLAVHAAHTLALFVLETWDSRS